jgi:DNA repair protein RecO (recombination protein O)
MGLFETEAIVLRTFNLAEADKIVVCLTRESGVVRAVARGARKLKSRFGAGLEPFTLINLSYYEKEGRELVSLGQAEIMRSYFKLSSHTEAVAALSYLCELVIEFAPPHEPNERLFRMVSACIEAISATPEQWQSLVRYFEVWMLRLSGFLPDMRACAECGRRFGADDRIYFNAEFKLRCGACSQGQGTLLSTDTHAQLRAMQRLSPQDFAKASVQITQPVRAEMAQVTRRLIERILERTPRAQLSIN